eukprot:scaffold105883_cov43-Prasinocladus_malaysianus.AAC.1
MKICINHNIEIGCLLVSQIDAFGRSNVVAVDSGMLKTRRLETLSKVLNDLGLDPNEIQISGEEELSDVYHSTHPDLYYAAWERLNKFYEKDSKKLAEILGEDWPKQWALNIPNEGAFDSQHDLLQTSCEVRSTPFDIDA